METNIERIKLKSCDYRLYDLLSNNEKSLTLEEICKALPDDFVFNEKYTHNPCLALWHSINRINQSHWTDKIIIKVRIEQLGNGKSCIYKFANEEELRAYIAKLEKETMQQLTRLSNIKKKFNRDSQGKLLNNQGKELNSCDEEVHDTYIK